MKPNYALVDGVLTAQNTNALAAADQIIEVMKSDDYEGRVPQDLLKTAGVALANKYRFHVHTTQGTEVTDAATQKFEDLAVQVYAYDQKGAPVIRDIFEPVGHLQPKGWMQDSEGVFIREEGDAVTIQQTIDAFQACGFKWDKAKQAAEFRHLSRVLLR